MIDDERFNRWSWWLGLVDRPTDDASTGGEEKIDRGVGVSSVSEEKLSLYPIHPELDSSESIHPQPHMIIYHLDEPPTILYLNPMQAIQPEHIGEVSSSSHQRAEEPYQRGDVLDEWLDSTHQGSSPQKSSGEVMD